MLLTSPRGPSPTLLLAISLTSAGTAGLLAGDLEAPFGIQCYGFAKDYNVIFWRVHEGDETEYRLEHSVNGRGDFHEHKTIPASPAFQGQPWKEDAGLNPDEVYYYRVRSFRARDGSFSPYSDTVRSPSSFDTGGGHFTIFYNLSSDDAPPYPPELGGFLNDLPGTAEEGLEAIRRLGRVLEGVRAEYGALGFRPPWQWNPAIRMPVNVKWTCNGGQFPANGLDGVAISPQFLGDYDATTNTGTVNLYNTPLHELFHGITDAYRSTKSKALDENWIVEGPTDAMVDLACVLEAGQCVTVDDDPGTSYYSLVYDYLGDPGRTLTDLLYPASLFWVYLCDHYGRGAEPAVEPSIGVDFLRVFHEEAERHPRRDAIEDVEATIQALAGGRDFAGAFTEFAIANYAKGLSSGVPFSYRYTDDVPSLPYPPVALDESFELGPSDSWGPKLAAVRRWAARYYEVLPRVGLDYVDVHVVVETPAPVNVVILILRKNGDVDARFGYSTRDYHDGVTLQDALDSGKDVEKIGLIVVGLEEAANYRYSIHAVDELALVIDQPTSAQPVCMDCGTKSQTILARVAAFSRVDLQRIEGLDPGLFTLSVNGTPCTVLSAIPLGAEYWCLVSVPGTVAVQESSLSLAVDYPGFSRGESPGAVSFCPGGGCGSDTVLILDRSSSMSQPDTKLASALEAAKLYVDSFHAGDRVGIVSFNGSASDTNHNMTLQDWTESSRSGALGVLGGINAAGLTSIGSGLIAGLGQLIDGGRRGTPWSLILLSDGRNTTGADIPAYFAAQDLRRLNDDPAEKQVPQVHTIGIGADANRPDLDDLASRTGGTYHFITEPPGGAGAGDGGGATDSLGFHRGISEIFRVVSERVGGHQQVYSATGTVAFGQAPVSHAIFADAASSELVIAVSGSSRMGVVVRNLDVKQSYLPTLETAQHRVYRIAPLPGARFEVSLSLGSTCEGCPIAAEYLVEASVKSTFGMDLFLPLPEEERVAGAAMPILVALHGARLGSPEVEATVRRQDGSGSSTLLTLFDDGLHGDGKAKDGLFGSTYRFTGVPGDYEVEAVASQTAGRVFLFRRRRVESFHMRAGADPDGDGMPSEYEARVGLDPAIADATLDADGDGLRNIDEFLLGTDPLDPDTDDDGESDFSELWHSRDPHLRGDGAIHPPRIRARAGTRSVTVAFNEPAGAVSFEVYRSAGNKGSFELYRDGVAASGPDFVDANVEPGVAYGYRFVSIGANAERSGPSNTAEATPRADPYPPHGSVSITSGLLPRSKEVMLQLSANDDPLDDHVLPRIGIEPLAEMSGVADMIISNRSDFSPGGGAKPVFEPFASSRRWLLEPDASGHAIVFARFRDRAGNVSEKAMAAIRVERPGAGGVFRRGDSNADGKRDISDAIFTLGYLFLGGGRGLDCAQAADSNDDGSVNISDPIHTLAFLFGGGAPPPAPFPDCGEDGTPDSLGCQAYPACQ